LKWKAIPNRCVVLQTAGARETGDAEATIRPCGAEVKFFLAKQLGRRVLPQRRQRDGVSGPQGSKRAAAASLPIEPVEE
jgi:hypothetical protein